MEEGKAMKAITIKVPWINKIVSGEKTIETRMWTTKHRGKLLLVSSKTADGYGMSKFKNVDPCLRGHAIAIADLVSCRPMLRSDKDRALCDYWEKLYAWILDNVREIEPFPVRGQLGLYEVEIPT